MNIKLFTEDAVGNFLDCIRLTLLVAVITLPVSLIIFVLYAWLGHLPKDTLPEDFWGTFYKVIFCISAGFVWLLYLYSLVLGFFRRSKLIKDKAEEKENKDLQDFIEFSKKR